MIISNFSPFFSFVTCFFWIVYESLLCIGRNWVQTCHMVLVICNNVFIYCNFFFLCNLLPIWLQKKIVKVVTNQFNKNRFIYLSCPTYFVLTLSHQHIVFQGWFSASYDRRKLTKQQIQEQLTLQAVLHVQTYSTALRYSHFTQPILLVLLEATELTPKFLNWRKPGGEPWGILKLLKYGTKQKNLTSGGGTAAA